MQGLGAIITVAIALIGIVCHIYEFYPLSPGLFGLALAYGLPIVANMNGLLNAITETEKEMISAERVMDYSNLAAEENDAGPDRSIPTRLEDHTSELQSLMRISYAVFCLKKKNKYT